MKAFTTVVLALALSGLIEAKEYVVRALVESYRESVFSAFLEDGGSITAVGYTSSLKITYPEDLIGTKVEVSNHSPVALGHPLREIDGVVEFHVDKETFENLTIVHESKGKTMVTLSSLVALSVYEESELLRRHRNNPNNPPEGTPSSAPQL